MEKLLLLIDSKKKLNKSTFFVHIFLVHLFLGNMSYAYLAYIYFHECRLKENFACI